MGLFKVLGMKTDNLFRKYKVNQRIEKITSAENIRIIGWIFIISRAYRIYQLVLLI